MSGVTLERHEGTLVAAKRSDSVSRLTDEADLLSRLGHPGVVEFVSMIDGDHPVLLTVWAGTDTWDRCSPTGAAAALHSLAAVATTLIDLHSAGVAHRSVSPDHVIIANDGRPVLCGLGHAGPADKEAIDADRLGLRRLVGLVADAAGSDHIDLLEELDAMLDDPTCDLVDFAIAAQSHDHRPADRTRRAIGFSPRSIAVSIGIAATVAVMWLVSSPSTGSRPASSPPTPIAIRASDSPRVTSKAPTPTVSSATASPAASPPSGPHGDVAALTVEHAGRLYALGTDGDTAVIGDWDCDGEQTPAVLQIASGRVAVFDAWPDVGGTLLPNFTVVRPDAETIVVERVDDCDLLRAHGPYGSTIISEEPS